MRFIELTSSTNNNKIMFSVEDIVATVDHINNTGQIIESMSFLWLKGMQEPFSVKESAETIISKMKDALL